MGDAEDRDQQVGGEEEPRSSPSPLQQTTNHNGKARAAYQDQSRQLTLGSKVHLSISHTLNSPGILSQMTKSLIEEEVDEESVKENRNPGIQERKHKHLDDMPGPSGPRTRSKTQKPSKNISPHSSQQVVKENGKLVKVYGSK
jgi:hypothetical protein